jgi:glyoxylase-like metal-dependent hydrolase (beta-lactamase superfamily II)
MMDSKIDCVTVGAIQTNCWLYSPEPPAEEGAQDTRGRRPCIIIDPGEEAGAIISRLNDLNWVPRSIYLTHGHLDHLAALPDLLETFGINGEAPETGIHRLDAHYLGKNAFAVHRKSFSASGGDPSFVDALYKPLPDAGVLFEEGDKAGPFTILHVPGHTPGSIALYDEKTGVLFSGDTLFQGTWGRTDLPGGSDAQLFQSLKRLLSMKGDIVVCPGHGAPTTIQDEKVILSILPN